ncbi:MAG: nucleoside-diphosphate sugar epimerase, partial [Pseudomonadota bacterium]|nr:nucleoside-diphosphate sugar epimerase [Pseudomonadota bacterium]
TYALPGGETLAYRDMVRRTLASLQPPARLLEVPAPLFRTALAGARLTGRLTGANTAVLARMRQHLVFDAGPAVEDFGYAPRGFDPAPSTFIR